MTARTAEPQSGTYRTDIDGLRAIAVIAVIINHFDKRLLPGGFLGVDIFFVISGYVITASLMRHRGESLFIFLNSFYQRRLKRLTPALVAMVSITAVLICLVNPNPGLSLQTGLTSLIGFSNILLYKLQTDYFAGSTELNVFTHTWSLGVEEQFYFIFPILFWVSGFQPNHRPGKRLFTRLISFLTVTSLICFIYLKLTSPDAAFFLLPSRFWEMAIGCLLFAHRDKFALALPRSWAAAWAGLILIIFCLFLPASLSLYSTILLVFGVALLIGTLPTSKSLAKHLSSPPLVYIGLISYSLYLWHWPILSLSRWTVGIHLWTAPFQIILIYALARGSYLWIEKPLRSSKWSSRPWLSFLYGLLAIAGTGSLIVALGRPLEGKLFTGQTNKLKEDYIGLNQPELNICNLFDDNSVVGNFPDACGLKAKPGKPTIFLLGDSHIHQFRSAIGSYAKQHGAGLIGIWGNACPFPALPDYAFPGDSKKQECIALQTKASQTLFTKVNKGDIVFLGNYLTAYFTDVSGAKFQEKARLDYSARLRSMADKLVEKGATVVIYLNAPRFPGLEGMSEGYCYPQWFKPALSKACFTPKHEFVQKRQNDFGWINAWADGNRRIVWDGLDPSTCTGKLCQASHYKDEAHFLDYYASYLFRNFLRHYPNLVGNSLLPTPAGSQLR